MDSTFQNYELVSSLKLSKLKKPHPHNHLLSGLSVIAGKSSKKLAKRIAKRLDADLVKTRYTTFPDGEGKITLGDGLPSDKVVVVQSIQPPVDTSLVQALSLIAKARESAQVVVAVIPYMGYARQDKEFLSGEIVTMKVLARLIRCAGASEVIVVDIHSKIGLKHFKIKARNVTAVPELAGYFKKMPLKDPLVVSPDKGGQERAKEFADNLKIDCITLEKHRNRRTGRVSIKTKNVAGIKGADLILVDDMISTGGSIVKATEFLKSQGCGRVFVACTHGLLVNGAEEKIKKAGVAEIISTNTIPGDTANVDMSGPIAQALMHLVTSKITTA